jgi:hypothetical protein
MSNLTFDENLVRECSAEPLEGHTVVVLERVGEKGEKFHSLLEPGADPLRQNPFSGLFGKPNVYPAYAVDMSRGRSLEFTEHVQMAERVHDFDLHFSLWYRVGDPQLLVATRTSDPLGRVRKQVAEVVAEEMAEQPWGDVWNAFRATSESVVARTAAELRTFARDYGLTIVTLRLRATFPDKTLQNVKDIYAIEADERVKKAQLDAERNVETHRSNLLHENAERDAVDRAEAAWQEVQKKMVERYVELIGTAGSVEDLHDIQMRVFGGGGGPFGAVGPQGRNGTAAVGAGNRHAQHTLPPAGGNGLAGILADLVTFTECHEDGKCRLLRSRLLHVVAVAVGEDSTQVSQELADLARRARVEIDSAQLPPEGLFALYDLTDPARLRQRL